MRALLLLLPLALLAAGCVDTFDAPPEESADGTFPEESTALPEESTEGPAGDVTVPTPEPTPEETAAAPPATASPTPVAIETPPPAVVPPPAEPAPPPAQATPPPPPPPAQTPPPPAQTTPPPQPASWPREGSFVRYEYRGGEGVPGYDEDVETSVRLTYSNGAWTGVCEGVRREWVRGGNDDGSDRYTNTTIRQQVSFAPFTGPTSPTIGQEFTMTVLSECGPRDGRMRTEGTQTHTAPREPAPIPTWYGHYNPGTGEPYDTRAWWDKHTGLILAYDYEYSRSADRGWIEDTDAPLNGS